jgi:hypothetical protein
MGNHKIKKASLYKTYMNKEYQPYLNISKPNNLNYLNYYRKTMDRIFQSEIYKI